MFYLRHSLLSSHSLWRCSHLCVIIAVLNCAISIRTYCLFIEWLLFILLRLLAVLVVVVVARWVVYLRSRWGLLPSHWAVLPYINHHNLSCFMHLKKANCDESLIWDREACRQRVSLFSKNRERKPIKDEAKEEEQITNKTAGPKV